MCCMEGNKEMAMQLLDAGADPRLKDSDDKVAFHHAPNEQVEPLVQYALSLDNN